MAAFSPAARGDRIDKVNGKANMDQMAQELPSFAKSSEVWHVVGRVKWNVERSM